MTSSNENLPVVVAPAPAPTCVAAAASTLMIESLFDVDATARPTIDVKEGMAAIIDECVKSLVKTGLVFDRGGILVCIDRDNSIHQMNSATIRFALSKLMQFEKSSLHKGQVVTEPVVVPSWVGDTIAALTKWPGMPIVDAISDHPFFTASGRLVGAGYDAETRVFGRFDNADFNIPLDPTQEAAATALADVRRLLQTFEFETDGDEAAALAGMLCAVCRPALPTAPLNLIDAPMPGSGKGYLGGLMARLAQNKQHPAKRMGENGDEMHKEIASALLAAKPVVFFDELSIQEIDCAAIRMLASTEIYSARLLGVMREVDVSTKTFVVATGNNISATADTARRMLSLRLNPMVENPSCRQFKYSASDDMTANRDHFVTQLLVVQKAFLLAQSRGETTRPEQVMGGFNSWDLMCRQPILWLLEVDPCDRMLKIMKSNPAKNELLAIMSAWAQKFGTGPTKAGVALQYDDFREVCEETIRRKPGSPVSSIGLALWLKKHKGQIIGKRFFDEAGVDHVSGVQFWCVKELP